MDSAGNAVKTFRGGEMLARDCRGQPVTSKKVTAAGRELGQDPRGSTEWQEDRGKGDDEWLDEYDDDPEQVREMVRRAKGRKMF